MSAFDMTVITARDRQQQWLFQQRLAAMRWSNWTRDVMVVPDPPGPQAGSGGSTVFALCAALDRLGISLAGDEGEHARLTRALASRRILVVHCGGQSQRVPQFASLGKAFAPVSAVSGPEGGYEPLSVFEAVVESLTHLTGNAGGGVTIACGDVLYRASPPEVFPDADAVVWAWPAGLSQASRHGVILWDAMTGEAQQALQKPAITALQELGFSQRAPLDTGVVHLSPRVTATMLASLGSGQPAASAAQLAMGMREQWQGLDLYRDLLPAMCARDHRASSFDSQLVNLLHRFKLQVLCPGDGAFVHFGTTDELLKILQQAQSGDPILINSVVEESALTSGGGVILQHCRVESPFSLGQGSFALGLDTRHGSVAVGERCLAYRVPLRRGRAGTRDAAVVLGVADDPKLGDTATLLNEPLEAWADRRGLRARDLWSDRIGVKSRTLWNARVFPVGPPERLPEMVEWLQNPDASGTDDLPKLSLAEIHQRFDARRWWRYEGNLRARRAAEQIVGRMEQDEDLSAAQLSAVAEGTDLRAVRSELQQLAERLENQSESSQPFLGARVWRVCATLARETRPEQPLHGEAFAAICRGLTAESQIAGESSWHYPVGQEVRAEAPVRIDIAGGWTDTPPQACEMGGRVLNIALTLDGELPIRSVARVIPELEIRFSALDLGLEQRIKTAAEFGSCQDPLDPFALHKASLIECGIIPSGTFDLPAILARMGGGLLLETEARVPKGSGLGTSSILGATVMGCLRQLTGRDTAWRALFRDVLAVEQRITSGGGWQDQIGGLLPGVKVTETVAGLEQVPHVTEIRCSPETQAELERRLVLFYTGVPRLARNVLQRVVARYLAREPGMRSTLRRMAELAEETAKAFRVGDFAAIGTAMRESWEMNQFLEPTATNAGVDAIIARVAPYCDGWKLAGAGGGGFLVALAQSAEAAQEVRAILAALPEGQLFEAHVAAAGLSLRVAAAS